MSRIDRQFNKVTAALLRFSLMGFAVLLLAGWNFGDPQKSSIVVESNPADAQIFLDGMPQGQTPNRISELTPGKYLVEVRKEGYERIYRDIALLEGQQLDLDLQLEKNVGLLLVSSIPEGSEVLINGEFEGITPVLVTDLQLGSYQVEIRSSALTPRLVDVELMDRTPVQVSVRHAPRMAVNSYPAGAEIQLDGEVYGQAPLILTNLLEDTYQITAILNQYDSQVREVTVQPGLNNAIEFNLEKNSGTVVLDTEPALVEVYVDGILYATTQPNDGSDSISQPLSLYLKAGMDHTIQLVRDGFISSSLTVRTEVDQIYTHHAILKHIFVYDTKITTENEVILCRIEYKLPNGDIYYERYPGVYHTSKATSIRNVEPISLDDESNRDARRMIEQSKLTVP
jgi:hypothetical protein